MLLGYLHHLFTKENTQTTPKHKPQITDLQENRSSVCGQDCEHSLLEQDKIRTEVKSIE